MIAITMENASDIVAGMHRLRNQLHVLVPEEFLTFETLLTRHIARVTIIALKSCMVYVNDKGKCITPVICDLIKYKEEGSVRKT